jgi:hypothetical protein
MSRRFVFALATLFACLAAPIASAAILPSGVDTSLPKPAPGTPPVVQCDCSVLWFGTDTGNEVGRVQSLGFLVSQEDDPALLTPAYLAQFNVLVIAYLAPGTLAAAQPMIAAWVDAGGGLLIHQPNAIGAIDYAPAGFEATVTHEYWCGLDGSSAFNVATIVNSTHPVTADLADTDLSGDFDTVENIGPGYTVLTHNLDCTNTAMALGVGNFGAGHVAFETGNTSVTSIRPGTNLYWHNLYSWLCSGTVVPTRTQSWGTLKAHYR